MSLARRTKDTLRGRLPLSLKLSLKRLFVGTVAAVLRVGARAVNLFDRVLLSATTHGLDFHQAWDIKARPRAPEVQPWGAADFLFVMDAIKGSRDGVPAPDRPVRASIVLLAYNKIEYTFQCLRSVFQEVDLNETEIIVVDNGSSDATARVLSHLECFIRVITIEQNAGFLDACNLGARAARGRYLILLNNDIVLLPGWLAPLVATVESDPAVGAVGSMYIYPNGILQDAGSIVWKDGNSMHYGWGRSPEDKRFNFAREVDYCPGASFLIRKELFDQLGGLDRRYAPAYYEDVDLCFGVRALGYKVIYQPLSRVIHHEGITLGTNVNTGFKRFQVINREKFYEKWRDQLEREHYEAAPENVVRASDRRRGPALLVCDDRLPTPDRDAGSARMSFILGSLARWSRPVFVSLSKQEWPGYEKPLWQAGVETASAVELRRLLKERQFRAALISRPEVAGALIPLLRRHAPHIKIIYDMVDAHFIRHEREAELTGDAETARAARRYRDMETRLARASDFIYCTSADEKEIMERVAPGVPVAVVPTIHELHERGGSFDERQHLLFIGNLAHRPNRDGVLYFLREVYPLIKQALPSIELDIIGDNPAEIQAHAGEAVRVRGYVPDVEPFWQTRRVFVAPLRYGAGVKGKIGESLAHGLPVVTTPVGAEGMGLAHEESAMIAATPAAFADAVVELYTRPDLWQRLADRGYEHVARHFAPARIAPVIEDSMKELLAARSK
jgi:GT2 family glycosyltransferase